MTIPDGRICHREARLHEAQQLDAHVLGDARILLVLHVPAVDAKSGQSLLGIAREGGGEVDRARPLGAIEAPDRFGQQRIRVHDLRAVAPAGRDREAHAHALALELLGAGRGFRDAADAGVRDDAFHRQSVRVAEFLREQVSSGLGHRHHLLFEGLPDPLAASINDGTDPDLGETPLQTLNRWADGKRR